MTTAQVVETSVTVNNNSPIQDYVHPDDQTQPTFEMTPGFKPFPVVGDYFIEKVRNTPKKQLVREWISCPQKSDLINQLYKTNRKDLGDPMPETYKKNGKVYLKEPYKGKKGKDVSTQMGDTIEVIEEMTKELTDILIDPQNTKNINRI